MLVVDQQGLIQFANPTARTALGVTEVSDLLGENCHKAIHYKYPDGTDFPPEECAMLLPRATGRTAHAEDWLVRRNGSLFPVEYWSAPISMPGGDGTVVAFTDVSCERQQPAGALRERDAILPALGQRRRAERELMASRARLVTAFDAARQRLSRDLHDGAQQRFVSTIISLQLAQQKWEAEPGHARELLDLALEDARRGIDELREIAAGIHPVLLTRRGLGVALSALTGRLPFPVELELPERRLPAPIEESVYFFCSEALTNAVKHARASSASVRVAMAGDRCTVEVRDDGIGGAVARSDTSGLTGLRDRVGALNGAMDIVSPATGGGGAGGADSGGTVLRAWIPLPGEAGG